VGQGRGERERGAAVVEFAFVIPVLAMLLVGMISSGILYNKQMQLTHATREGARYGATVPEDQTFSSGTWATNVRNLVVDRSAGELENAQVCVALVVSNPPVPITTDGSHTTQSGNQPCFDDSGGGQSGKRVQVKVQRPGELDAVFLRIDVTLGAKATAKHESA